MRKAILVLFFLLFSLKFFAENTMKYIAVSTFDEEVKIDGLGNEKFWGKAILDSLTINVVAPENYTASDYKVYFKAAYDYTNFYCIAFVTDDKLLSWDESQFFAWQSDCIEMFFNPYKDVSTGKLEECHFLAGINNREYPPVFSGQLFQSSSEPEYFEEYKYYTTITKNGYIIEMQLPWDILIDRSLAEAPFIEAGTQIPWDINGCDADDPAVRRDLISSWSANWDRDWFDNSQYGILELGDDQVNALHTKDNVEIQLRPISKKVFNLTVNKTVKPLEVCRVFDISGKLVFQQILKSGENTINLEYLSAGIYILSTIENKPFQQKIVVN
jgi:hypothetical protein